jgi:hypothetical protein
MVRVETGASAETWDERTQGANCANDPQRVAN